MYVCSPFLATSHDLVRRRYTTPVDTVSLLAKFYPIFGDDNRRFDAKDILEEVSDDCDDIFEKVSDDAKDILEKVSDEGDDDEDEDKDDHDDDDDHDDHNNDNDDG